MFERDRTEEYREYMIRRILELQTQDQYTKADLQKKATSQLEDIFAEIEQEVYNMNFKELRQASGMNQTKFAEYFDIPRRTVQNWELGINKCPDYLLKLMHYILQKEGFVLVWRYNKAEPIVSEELWKEANMKKKGNQ